MKRKVTTKNGITTISFWEVWDDFAVDGRGDMRIIGNFWDKKTAEAFAKKRGNYEKDANVTHREFVIMDNAQKIDEYEEEIKRRRALAKLNEEDKKVLKLAD